MIKLNDIEQASNSAKDLRQCRELKKMIREWEYIRLFPDAMVRFPTVAHNLENGDPVEQEATFALFEDLSRFGFDEGDFQPHFFVAIERMVEVREQRCLKILKELGVDVD